MGARATFHEREGFSLDANCKVGTSATALGCDLGNIKTIRLILLDATVVQKAGAGTAATIALQDTDDSNATFYTISSDDLVDTDENGVYMVHLRGSLYAGIKNVRYVYTAGTAGGGTAGTITGFSVYIDAVD